MPDDFDPEVFAQGWAAAWNSLDLDRILGHFSEECSFTSPLAASLTGSATLRGRIQLADYWHAALQQVHDLHFQLDRLAWDADRFTLMVLYVARLNGQARRAAEVWVFDVDQQICQGEALYGAVLT